jgi:predicted alpha/beta-fold hydrolase
MNFRTRPVTSALQEPLGIASGHFWTIAGWATRGLAAQRLDVGEELLVTVGSGLGLPVTLRGVLHAKKTAPAERRLIVLVHGLGGTADSGYMRDVAASAVQAGLPTLRLNLRGADDRGWDFYHAGLTDDLLAVLESPRLAAYESIYVFGFSLGGHVTLRLAGDPRLPQRVRAVTALCPPLDLEASAEAFDAGVWVYRAHVLRGLKAMYRRFVAHVESHDSSVIARLGLPSLKGLDAISRIRQWDEQIVAPRHGFTSASAYYHAQRVSSRLQELRVPSLVVTARWDPMVPHSTTSPVLLGGVPSSSSDAWRRETALHDKLVHWELPSGGHVAWPSGRKNRDSVVHHMLDWLTKHGASAV